MEWGRVSPSVLTERVVHVKVHCCRLLGVVVEPHGSPLWIGLHTMVEEVDGVVWPSASRAPVDLVVSNYSHTGTLPLADNRIGSRED